MFATLHWERRWPFWVKWFELDLELLPLFKYILLSLVWLFVLYIQALNVLSKLMPRLGIPWWFAGKNFSLFFLRLTLLWDACVSLCCGTTKRWSNQIHRSMEKIIQGGWRHSVNGLVPTGTNAPQASPNILKMIFCSCTKGCSAACDCRKVGIFCNSVSICKR